MQTCPNIEHLNIRLSAEDQPPDENRVLKLEKQIGANLPEDYRAFLLRYGGAYVDLVSPITEPTPKGNTHLISSFTTLTDDPESWRDIRYYFDSFIVPRNVIYIASGDLAHGTCLSFAGIDKGSVYYLDEDQLIFANDSHPLKNIPTMKEFERLQKAKELLPKSPGYECLYHIADSFTEFIAKCSYSGDE